MIRVKTTSHFIARLFHMVARYTGPQIAVGRA
ncbi:hypothetical protein GGR93_003831 [Sulfitobacter noctilucicola]|uniref:Uncharacterized protein n=1 Tax=Sulfitobacter noctilucicola TaxID=1342301 RepID=A0A7W6MBI2_9RHOB|nr:hypothetical protein [Sulfitobacter noctilucicola]